MYDYDYYHKYEYYDVNNPNYYHFVEHSTGKRLRPKSHELAGPTHVVTNAVNNKVQFFFYRSIFFII